MRRPACALLMLLLAAMPWLAGPVTLQGGKQELRRHLGFVRLAHESPPLVLLGDSHLYLWSKPWLHNGRLHTYWNSYLPDLPVANFGYPGDDVRSLEWRIRHGELDGNIPAAILLIGANDLLKKRSPERVAAEIAALIDTIRAIRPGIRLLLLGVPPLGETPDNPIRWEVTRLNALLERVAQEKQLRWRDLTPALLNPDGSLSAAIAPDRIHLSHDGYKRWAALLLQDRDFLWPP